MALTWSSTNAIVALEYKCGFCSNQVATKIGWTAKPPKDDPQGAVAAICPFCGFPTIFSKGKQMPGVRYGDPVTKLPGQVEPLYEEVRDAMSVSAHTLAVMGCRKILANTAVDLGAKEGQSFVEYVDYLATEGYVPPTGRAWVDHIRNKGNEANHEIHMMSSSDAEEVVTFTQMMLTFVYELPGMLPPPPTDTATT